MYVFKIQGDLALGPGYFHICCPLVKQARVTNKRAYVGTQKSLIRGTFSKF